MPKFLNRFSAYGDLAGKAMRAAVNAVPWFMEPVLLFCYSAIYTLLMRTPLRAVQRNLETIFAHLGKPVPPFAQFRTTYQFAATMTEAVRAATDPESIQWTIEGSKELHQLINEPNGAVLLTVHMGSYDLAATSFAEKLGRNINMVRVPERHEETQKITEKEFANSLGSNPNSKHSDTPRLIVHFNRKESLLGVDLARAIMSKEFVAIQGDRVMADVSGMTSPAFGKHIRMPKGPFVLAEATRAPIYPLFIIRKGWRAYAIRTLPPLPVPETRDRKERVAQRAAAWTEKLSELITEEWQQWFVFEDAFRNQPEDDDAAPIPKS